MSTTLYRKHRPQSFDELVGQEHIKQTLQNELLRDQIAHAYLFSGARGLGKTTTARIFAKSLNCLKRKPDKAEPCNKCANCLAVSNNRFLDLIEIDAASNRGINEIRELKEHIGFTPSGAKYRIFIIDEVHMLTPEAFNALLKTLEEPPEHVIFILATTEAHKLPATVVSRCQRFSFHRVQVKDAVRRLSQVVKAEGVEIDKKVLERIALLSRGYLRDAESLLGQVISASGKKVTLETATLVLPQSDRPSVEAFVNHLSIQDVSSAISLISELSESGIDLSYFTGEVIEFLRQIVLAQFEVEQDGEDMSEWVGKYSKTELLLLINLLTQSLIQSAEDIPELPLELAVLEYHVRLGSPGAAADERVSAKGQAEVKKVVDIQKDSAEKSPDLRESPATKLGLEELSLDEVKKRWREVVVISKKHNHSLPFIFKIAHPISVSGDVIELGFEYDFHLDRLNDSKTKRQAIKVFSEVFSRNLKVVGTKLDKERAKQVRAERGETFEDDKSLLDNVMKAFGGKVVE